MRTAVHLYDPVDHEPQPASKWDEGAVLTAIREIVADTEEHYSTTNFWPIHPLEFEDSPTPPETIMKNLYFGAAGVIWGLWHLGQSGLVELRHDYVRIARMAVDHYLQRPDTGETCPSYMLGAGGILLVAFRLSPSAELAEKLAAAIEANIENPTNELFWASPGTALASVFLHEWTGEPRWQDLLVRHVRYMWSRWEWNPDFACHLWKQDLYGSVRLILGAGHGFAGNVFSLLRAWPVLDAKQREETVARTACGLSRFALTGDGVANWPVTADGQYHSEKNWRVQWCHGAPGIVTSLAGIPLGAVPNLDAMLEQGAELAWRAGPLRKGPGMCHGTASSGFAFLKLYLRTGDRKWLERARTFAMHAIRQIREQRARFDRGWYSLWTGDLGTAIYLKQCLTEEAGIPTLDLL